MSGQRNGSRWWDFSVVFLVASIPFAFFARTLADNDLWGHVRFGQMIRETGSMHRVDPFSYLTEGQEWVNHEWLAEVAFGLAFDALGGTGLIALKVGVALFLFGVVYRFLVLRGLSLLRAGAVTLLVASLFMIGLTPVRPQLFTYLFFLLVLLVLEAAERGDRRWLWFLPPICALWVNFHGGVLAGLGVLGIWAAVHGATAVRRSRSLRALLTRPALFPAGIAAASAAATLANPYGPGLPLFLLRTATVPRPEITEWQPLAVGSLLGACYLGFLALVAAGLLASRRERRPALLAVLGITAVLPLLAVRHVPLFALAGAVLAGGHIADAWGRRSPADRLTEMGARFPRLRPWLAGVLVAEAFILTGAGLTRFDCVKISGGEAPRFPIRAVAVLEAAGAEGNLATIFNWGEYVIWHLGPRVKVSMDGRRETAYPDAIYEEHLHFLRGTGPWDVVLDDHPTDFALVSKRWPTFNLLELKPGWERVYEDGEAAIFVPEGSAWAERIRAAQIPDELVEARWCFREP